MLTWVSLSHFVFIQWFNTNIWFFLLQIGNWDLQAKIVDRGQVYLETKAKAHVLTVWGVNGKKLISLNARREVASVNLGSRWTASVNAILFYSLLWTWIPALYRQRPFLSCWVFIVGTSSLRHVSGYTKQNSPIILGYFYTMFFFGQRSGYIFYCFL